MKQEDLKFNIDQLRKDKIIYAVEACATSLVCILGFIFANAYFENPMKTILSILFLLTGIGYSIFMGIGNSFRLKKIKELEKKLSGNSYF